MKKSLVSKDSGISINRQLSLLTISKGGFYYVRKGESVENLDNAFNGSTHYRRSNGRCINHASNAKTGIRQDTSGYDGLCV